MSSYRVVYHNCFCQSLQMTWKCKKNHDIISGKLVSSYVCTQDLNLNEYKIIVRYCLILPNIVTYFLFFSDINRYCQNSVRNCLLLWDNLKYFMSCNVVFLVSCHVILRHVLSCYVMSPPCHVMLCPTMLYHFILFHVM